jgi:glyceraldehyde-3-phosphate dehydrogenase (NADP+)
LNSTVASWSAAPGDVPAAYRIDAPLRQDLYLVGGELRRWEGPLQPVLSPVSVGTGSERARTLVGEAPLLSPAAALEALEAAVEAYRGGRGEWPAMPLTERIRRVQLLGSALEERRQDIVRLLMWEVGKPLAEAEREVERTVACIRDAAAAAQEIDGASRASLVEQGIMGEIRRAPLGVALCVGPYNFPLYETFALLVPALLMGNSVLLKPPRFGILLFAPLHTAFRDLFPAGVINTVYGDSEELLPPLLSSGRIDLLGFVGTGKGAEELRALHPRPNRLRCLLGLGAKNAAIVLPDADLELASAECLKGSLALNGQRCTALKIIFVHRSVAAPFLARLSRGIGLLKCGDPWDDGVSLTALPEPEKPKYLEELVRDAVLHGARVVNPGGGAGNGYFFYPALLYPVNPAMRIYHEEQFGPLVPVVPYDDADEPVHYLVQSEYGQQASIFGDDHAAVAGLVDVMAHQVCRINLNSLCQRGPDSFPFNARNSACDGSDSMADALRACSIRTAVAGWETVANRGLFSAMTAGESRFLSL